MKKFSFTFLFVLLYCSVAYAQTVPVFISGTEGYKSFRIPAIIKLPAGKLLAFCEGRVHGSADFGDVNIVLKTSTDKGRTWSSLKTVVDYDSLQAGNAAPVLDMSDPAFPRGRIFLFYNTGNNHEGEVRKGKGLREVWYTSSVDDGETWSEPVNITTQVHRPLQEAVNPQYNCKEDWRSYANTPGHAFQFGSGKYKGRIYVAANHSAGPPLAHFRDYFSHGYYTDDHGKTFHLSETVNISGSNEATAAFLSDGGMILNARNQSGDIKSRIVAKSKDGGQSWTAVSFDKNLPDPVCEGTILNIDRRKGKEILAFCNAADTTVRNHLTLRISYDEGVTWTKNIAVDQSPSPGKNDYTAYSDIVLLDKNSIGVLYERDNYREIVFKLINWKQ